MGFSDTRRSYAAWLVEDVFPGYGNREAVIHGDSRLTYRELSELIQRLAIVFRNSGLRPGATVGLVSNNRAESVCVPFAAHLAGARFLSMAGDRGPAEYASISGNIHVDAVLMDNRVSTESGNAVVAAFPNAEYWSLGPDSALRDIVATAVGLGSAGPAEWAKPESVETVLCSGGTTTGLTKSILHRHRLYRAILAHPFLTEPVRLLVTSQIAHVGGLYALSALAGGSTLVLLDKFSPQAAIHAMTTERITAMMLITPMLYALLDDPALDQVDCSNLRRIMYGASPVTEDRALQAFDRFGPILWQLYAQTEAFGIAALDGADHALRPRSVGRAFPDMHVEVRGEAGRRLPPGEVGEICAKGPRVMDCYVNGHEATAAAFFRYGWLRTGDLGYKDEQGYIFLTDRSNDVIITGEAGSTVYSPLVENALASHPAVRAAAVIPVPHSYYGQAVHAVVVTEPGRRVEPDELRKHASAKLERPAYVPNSFEFVDALPLTPVGKVDKRAIRAPHWAGQDSSLHGTTSRETAEVD